jgi:hypothetical protein
MMIYLDLNEDFLKIQDSYMVSNDFNRIEITVSPSSVLSYKKKVRSRRLSLPLPKIDPLQKIYHENKV